MANVADDFDFVGNRLTTIRWRESGCAQERGEPWTRCGACGADDCPVRLRRAIDDLARPAGPSVPPLTPVPWFPRHNG